ncbi:MAG: hypothetical protein JSS61_02250 [Verrucomicrobia bacterium]|nr:hypothetical protein [Verrucomicrobiota bacterium]
MQAIVRFLNQPMVKEGIKNVAGTITCAFGILEVYDIYQILRGNSSCTEASGWVKTALICAKLSLILSAATARPCVLIFSAVLGSSGIFAENPWHPRHVFSIVAVILALPAIAVRSSTQKRNEPGPWLTDAKVRMMAGFNLVTSRPVLHLGNQLCRV